MRIKITKLRDNVFMPTRAHYNDAGADVYCNEMCSVYPRETIKIPLGFSIEIPDGYMACVYPKSGLSSKGIIAQLPPIDSGYRGEVHAIVTNQGDNDYIFHIGDKVGQLIVLPIILADFVTDLGDERNDGAFGSTGR